MSANERSDRVPALSFPRADSGALAGPAGAQRRAHLLQRGRERVAGRRRRGLGRDRQPWPVAEADRGSRWPVRLQLLPPGAAQPARAGAPAGADDSERALAGVLAELQRSGRVIIAADGFHLPWHVACGREHVPHWFTVIGSSDRFEIADPFACRNELGVQTPERRASDTEALVTMLPAIPQHQPGAPPARRAGIGRSRARAAWGTGINGLRPPRHGRRRRGTAPRPAAGRRRPGGAAPAGRAFETRGQEPDAYGQADDIWSIARHRAFLLRYAESRPEPEASAWVTEHGAALARRWGHIAPLLMQAVLSLRIGRPASTERSGDVGRVGRP